MRRSLAGEGTWRLYFTWRIQYESATTPDVMRETTIPRQVSKVIGANLAGLRL